MLCFRKLLAAKKLLDKKGEYKYFPSNIFCLTVPKKLVDEPFGVTLISGIKKIMLKGFRYDFSSILFLSQNRKTLQGNISVLCFRKFLVAKKFLDKKGEKSKFSVEHFLSNSAEKTRR